MSLGRDAPSRSPHPALGAGGRRAASPWEIAIKSALGKVKIDGDPTQAARDARCRELSITGAPAKTAGALPPHHADPFDRLLIAQAQAKGLTLIAADSKFAAHEVALA